ncbi:hypothetical protein BGZ67_005632 [Mortierella alpina]|nr:hypothetical protein BGZ67_005632 [Mortierella alpina]
MIEACALPKCSLTKLGDTIQHHLGTVATVVGSVELILLPREDDAGPLESTRDAPTKFLFRPYTINHQQQRESRRVLLKSMAFNTTYDDIKMAMASWGQVAHIKMGFNPIRSMRTAMVTFTDPAAVTDMIVAKTVCILVGDSGDVACVAQMGAKAINIDSSLTKKLAPLPPFFKPVDVVKMFESILNVDEGGVPAWVDVNTVLCRVHSSLSHRQAKCPIQQLHSRPATASTTITAAHGNGTPAKAPMAKASTVIPQRTTVYDLPSNINRSVSYNASLEGKEKTVIPCTPP